MPDGRIVQNRKRISHCDAVVAAERRSLGINISVVVRQAQTLDRKIDVAVRLLLADHVEMSLQNDGRVRLVSGGGRSIDHDVIVRILHAAQAALLGKRHAEIAHALRIPRTVGDGAERLEPAHHALRL